MSDFKCLGSVLTIPRVTPYLYRSLLAAATIGAWADGSRVASHLSPFFKVFVSISSLYVSISGSMFNDCILYVFVLDLFGYYIY